MSDFNNLQFVYFVDMSVTPYKCMFFSSKYQTHVPNFMYMAPIDLVNCTFSLWTNVHTC